LHIFSLKTEIESSMFDSLESKFNSLHSTYYFTY